LIQAAMYFSLGLLVAGLLALVVTPSIWRRAMRLARVRIEAGVPLTRAEINADKDQLRAGFAIANRRLEMETSRLKEKLAQESVALGRRNDEVAVLARGNTSLTEAVSRLESRAQELEEARAQSERKLAAAEAAVIARDTALADRESTLASLRADLGATQLMTEELRLEMVARATEISNLHDSLAMVSGIEAATAAARDRIGEDLAAEREQTAAAQ
jgi:hypothetical protein